VFALTGSQTIFKTRYPRHEASEIVAWPRYGSRVLHFIPHLA